MRTAIKAGLASEVEVEQARTILETTRAQLVDVGVARAQYEHAVAVLVGKPPAEFQSSAVAAHYSTAANSRWRAVRVARTAP